MIVETNFLEEANEVDYADLPTDLRRTLMQFKTLAITDDFEKQQKIEELTLHQRSDLISAVELKIEEINSFLVTFGDKPLSGGAIALQSLAELVVGLTSGKIKTANTI